MVLLTINFSINFNNGAGSQVLMYNTPPIYTGDAIVANTIKYEKKWMQISMSYSTGSHSRTINQKELFVSKYIFWNTDIFILELFQIQLVSVVLRLICTIAN